jgi:hypothetical protein
MDFLGQHPKQYLVVEVVEILADVALDEPDCSVPLPMHLP